MKPKTENGETTLVFVYCGEFAERVIRNLINDLSFCKSCGLYCDSCKYGVYSHVQNIRAAIELPHPSNLPAFIDEPDNFMPKSLPKADLCVASGLHKDLLLELPNHVEKAGIKGIVVPIEDFAEVPSGLRIQVEEKCQKLGLESAFPKPFCSLTASQDKPTISKLVAELKIGRPLFEVSTATLHNQEVIESVAVKRSAPCGSTWYIARKLLRVETEKNRLYDAVAKAHHSYPCTATMAVDPEAKEPILHIGGYIIREEVEKAIANARLSS
ncbi:thymidylate synthase [Candidatus Bathyarchaeota archaeon]|nr:thymidylate synthase [Candidatus Bathyarchaeota archaeon]